MRILGVDPGYHRTGLAVIEVTGNKITLLDSRVVETSASDELSIRLLQVYNELENEIVLFNPNSIAVEELFFAKNVKTGIGVAHARGVVLLAAAKSKLTVAEYKPAVIKLGITSNGNATKDQVLFMVERLLGMKFEKRYDDEIDAIAVAICHGFKYRMKKG
jgi:crossover junction endodeoxyribonuclease RuvC